MNRAGCRPPFLYLSPISISMYSERQNLKFAWVLTHSQFLFISENSRYLVVVCYHRVHMMCGWDVRVRESGCLGEAADRTSVRRSMWMGVVLDPWTTSQQNFKLPLFKQPSTFLSTWLPSQDPILRVSHTSLSSLRTSVTLFQQPFTFCISWLYATYSLLTYVI